MVVRDHATVMELQIARLRHGVPQTPLCAGSNEAELNVSPMLRQICLIYVTIIQLSWLLSLYTIMNEVRHLQSLFDSAVRFKVLLIR